MTGLSQSLPFLLSQLEKPGDIAIALYSLAVSMDGAGSYLPVELGYHRNPCCTHVKKDPRCHVRCIKVKNIKIRTALTAEGVRATVCPFGVMDVIFPIPEKDPQFILFISSTRRHVDGQRPGAEPRAVDPADLGYDKAWMDRASLIRGVVSDMLMAHRREWATHAPPGLLSQKVNLARHNIQHNCTQPWTLTGLARQLKMNPSVLAREYRKRWGITVHGDLNLSRVETAKGYLHSGATVTETAHEVGYRDSQYFSRVFRKLTGLAPRVWQEKYRKRPRRKGPPGSGKP